MKKYVYSFGSKKTDGRAGMKNLLGGKGANLAEMSLLRIPVPAGFTITTACCNDYLSNNSRFPEGTEEQVMDALKSVEDIVGMKYGDPDDPLLVSCRSGARSSMPGMMETVLNIGLCSKTIPGLVRRTQNERFVYDSYRRLITMYSDVVMEKAEGIEPQEGKGIRVQLERIMEETKTSKGYRDDTQLTVADLKHLCAEYTKHIKEALGKPFPDDPMKQLWGGIGAVFKSWNGKKAVNYRLIESIPDSWGTATNVQAMVFGNMGDTSATGVAFTRNPATGENKFYGEWLPNAQGEDVVAGIRTPYPINETTKMEQNRHLPSLETANPGIYGQLHDIQEKLEKHYADMQDIEFTIQEGKLYILQTRVGKRTGTAALNMVMDMLKEGLIGEQTAVMRLKPEQFDELLHPIVDPTAEKNATVVARGLPAGPGGASGHIVFKADDAVEWKQKGEKVILVRKDTNPEDVAGMRAAEGILTARGGMTSHAALVARGWGKCCIVGAGTIHIDSIGGKMTANGKIYREGDILTLNGTKGYVYEGKLNMMDATENPKFKTFMTLADRQRKLGVRANADTPADAAAARNFGAEGIGLFRTEHMFYGENSEEPLFLLRQMILSTTVEERKSALDKLLPYVKSEMKETLRVMQGLPVTFRLLDPPLHEFVPQHRDQQKELADSLGIDVKEIVSRGEHLHEVNPMMGHRGIRLGITYPEISEMQIRAIFEAAAELINEKVKTLPEIMIPVTCDMNELVELKTIIESVYREVLSEFNIKKIDYLMGTMIEIPRACLLANEMAQESQFFSFGTNDLTQMGFGFSRDDIGGFLRAYLDKKILKADPFQTIDQEGIGQLIEMGVTKGRAVRKDLKVGICGEHGGDPESIRFFHQIGIDYVSCSAFRIPIAKLVAAQAALEQKTSQVSVATERPQEGKNNVS